MQYLYFALFLLPFATIWASASSNQICLSPDNDNLYCEPQTSGLNQFLSLRSFHTCGEVSQRVCWNNPNERECQTCDSSDSSSSYPLSNLLDSRGIWISDGSSGAVIYLEGYKAQLISLITIDFLSTLPVATTIERFIECLYSSSQAYLGYSTIAYFTQNCSLSPLHLQSVCIEHSSPNTLEYSTPEGIKSDAIRITFESHPKSSPDQYYSHAVERIVVSGVCDCNGHASECSGEGTDRKCECQHNTAGRDCDSCLQGYYPSSNKGISDPNYCEVGCDCELCGVEDEFQPCNPVTKECICKRDVEGDRCDRCKSGFHSLSFSDSAGCQACYCPYGGAADLPCDAITGACYCRDGFIGTTCDVELGLYVPSLEQIFSIRNIADNLNTPTYVLLDQISGVRSGTGWRVSSEDSFYTQFSVGESGDYIFIPLITASSPDIIVVITLTSDSSESNSYSIPAAGLSQWNIVVLLDSQLVYTVSVEISSTDDLLVVEDLLFLPLESISIPLNRSILETLYPNCIPYNINATQECRLIREVSASLTQSPLECDCNEKGSILGVCDTYGGECYCIPNYGGRRCDQCSPGLHMGDNGICEPCNCDPIKSETAACNSTGYCYCTDTVSTDETSRTCSSCNPGYTLSSTGSCVSCDCDVVGSQDQICDSVSGECTCSVGYQGSRCDSCQSTHLSSGAQCVLCPCPGIEDMNYADQCFMIEGTVNCMCSEGFTGLTCEECDAGYFAEYSDLGILTGCRECECNGNGMQVDGRLCDGVTGQCLRCTGNTGGTNCEYCVEGFYRTAEGTCQVCDCDVTGSEEHLCNRYTGSCECREGFSGEKCDECAVNFFSSSDTCLACSACFNQVFELYSSLRGRLDVYQFLSQSGCTLLSPSLRELLDMYSRNVSLLHTDINLVNQVDAALFSALSDLSSQVQQLNTEVGNLLTDANQEQERAEDLQTTSEANYQSAMNTLESIENSIITFSATIVRISHVFQFVYIGIIKNIEDITLIVSRESELVALQRTWITESSDLSTELVNTAVETLFSAQKAVELQQNTTRLISWSFSLLRLLITQAGLLNSTYRQVEYVADTAEEYLQIISSLLDSPPINIPAFPHDDLSNDVLVLEEFVRQLRIESDSQVDRSNSAINTSQILIQRGEFLQNVTTVLLNRLNSHRLLAENAAEESNQLIQQLINKQIEINSTHTESVRLVELINQFFDLLNETQQSITIQSSEDTLVLVENAIEEVSQLVSLLITVNNLAETARVDSRSANQTINVMASKVDILKEDLTVIERQIVEVETISETLNQHEVEGEAELNETESTIDSISRYIDYFRSRVELLEEEFQNLNQSLIGIGIVSEEEIDLILKKLSLLETEAVTNYERLEYTERDLLEEKRELEYLERAVFESYRQIGEFDNLLDDLKEYNDEHSCN